MQLIQSLVTNSFKARNLRNPIITLLHHGIHLHCLLWLSTLMYIHVHMHPYQCCLLSIPMYHRLIRLLGCSVVSNGGSPAYKAHAHATRFSSVVNSIMYNYVQCMSKEMVRVYMYMYTHAWYMYYNVFLMEWDGGKARFTGCTLAASVYALTSVCNYN